MRIHTYILTKNADTYSDTRVYLPYSTRTNAHER